MSVSQSSDATVVSAARWFWWIAGLSLVNAILNFSGSDMNFVVGLGITSLATAMFAGNLPVAMLLVALSVGFYFVMGLQAQRERLWAFYAGLVVYGLDALIFVKIEDWMPVAFHGLAIFYIVKGVMRVNALKAVPAQV